MKYPEDNNHRSMMSMSLLLEGVSIGALAAIKSQASSSSSSSSSFNFVFHLHLQEAQHHSW